MTTKESDQQLGFTAIRVGNDMSPVRPNKAGKFPILPDGVHCVATGEGHQFRVGLMRDGDGIYVGVVGLGFYRFSHEVHPSYASEKLKAGLLADFINDQLGNEAPRTVKLDEALTVEWTPGEIPVELFAEAVVLDDDEGAKDEELARVRVTGLCQPGTSELLDKLVADLQKTAAWGLKRLYHGGNTPPPKVLESVVVAGGNTSAAPTGAEAYFASKHAERVKAAL